MKKRMSWGNFAAVAVLCSGSYALYLWRGGFSSSFLSCGTAMLLALSLGSMLFGLRRLRAERQLPQTRFFAGDDAFVTVTVRRGGVLPAGWIVATDVWTDGTEDYRYSRLLFPGWRSVVRFRYKLGRLGRGRYRFVRLELDAGDWVGLLRKRIVIPGGDEFAVYPKPMPLDAVFRGASSEAGRSVAPIRPDVPTTPVVTGIRHYAAGDPLQRIHWKATARTGSLKTKTTDSIEAERLAVVLDGSRVGFAGPEEGRLFEAGVRVAAGLLEWAVRRKAAASLRVGSDPAMSLPLACRPDMTEAYELLSRARTGDAGSGAEPLLRESASWPADCAAIYITANPDESLVRAARLLRAARRPVNVWIVQGEKPLTHRQRHMMRELETAGCPVTVLQSPRTPLPLPGGAEDVIA
ncbi:DUF58 domain-containing protein [Paenibacillus flagellatus]|uniref:Uncharacterized protein n=1 Tax=Paenibacillus flagellatus TaxID=2211139 RepID=A0A2V5K9Y6_9BACL|nr:DUF58 domain-containing protein [Paenibacillus flagellatus]PYI50630.1 hypothetical protein DLM86_28065 [Paenibacillus flagellatus]